MIVLILNAILVLLIVAPITIVLYLSAMSSGILPKPKRPLRCRFGLHDWVKLDPDLNESREIYNLERRLEYNFCEEEFRPRLKRLKKKKKKNDAVCVRWGCEQVKFRTRTYIRALEALDKQLEVAEKVSRKRAETHYARQARERQHQAERTARAETLRKEARQKKEKPRPRGQLSVVTSEGAISHPDPSGSLSYPAKRE